MASIFETIAQKVKGIKPVPFLDEDKIKPAPEGARILESARVLGKEAREEIGSRIIDVARAIPKTTFGIFEGISRVAGSLVQRMPGILQVSEEEREPFIPQQGDTLMDVIRRQPLFGEVVQKKLEKTPLGQAVPAVPVVAGFLSEFLLPPYGAGKAASFVDDLAKITSKIETKGLLLKGLKEITEKEADDLAVKLAPITDKKIIRQELDAFAKSKTEIAPDLQPLAQEARKYKSAEEFVGAKYSGDMQGAKVTPLDYSALDNDGRWTTQKIAEEFKVTTNKVHQLNISIDELPAPKYKGTINLDQMSSLRGQPAVKIEITKGGKLKILDGNHRIDQAIENGDTHIPAWVVDKSQLTDFYNQVTKEAVEKIPPTVEIKTKTPAYKRVLNQGYITTKDSWGNEYVQIRGKVPEIVKEKGVIPHSSPTVDTELNKFSEGAIQPVKLIKIGTQEGFTKTEMLQFQTSKGKDIFVNREYVNLALKEYPNAKFFGSESTKPLALKVGDKTVAVVMPIQEGKFAKDIIPVVKTTDLAPIPSPKSKAQAKSIEQVVQEVIPKKTLLKEEVSQELANSRILSSLPPDKQITVTKSIAKEFAEYKKAQEGVKGLWTTIREKVQDSFIRARKLQQQVSKGDPIPENIDIDQARTLFDGRVATRLEEVKESAKSIDKDIVSTAKALKTSSDELAREVDSFLHARHALERNAKLGDGAAGLKNADAEAILDAYKKSPHKADIDRIANQISELNSQTLKVLLDSEVIDQELFDLLTKTYKNHIPLQRVMSETDDIVQILSGKGFDVKSTGLRKAVGSDKPVADILTNVVANLEQATIRAEKNLVDLTTLRFARANKELGIFEEMRIPRVPVANITHKEAIDTDFFKRVMDLGSSLGAKFETKGQPGRRLGFFRGADALVSRKVGTPREVLSHEVGHFFDSKFGLKEKFFKRGQTKAVAEEMEGWMKEIGESANRIKNTKERFADSFEWWLTNRALAEERLPLFSKAMSGIINDIPALKPLLDIKPTGRFSVQGVTELMFREAPEKLTSDPTVLTLREKGKPIYLKINDQRLAVALKGVNVEKIPSLLRGVSSITRLYAGLHTRFNYEFAFSNVIRDTQEMAVYMASRKETGFGGATKALTKQPESVKAVFDFLRGADTEGAKLYKQMRLDGGTTGGLGLSTREQVSLDIEAIRKLNRSKPRQAAEKAVELVDKWNTIFEDSTRLSVYKAALDKGLSRGQAANLAKEATLNFNKKGTAGPLINGLYMFSNASIQGTTKMLTALKNPKVLGAVAATLGGAIYTTNEWNDSVDPDWRDKVTKWDRSSNLVIMLPSEEGTNYLTIPISWGLKPIKVALEYGYDVTTGHGDLGDAVQGIITSVFESYNPLAGDENLLNTITPTLLKVPIEISSNRAWYGSAIKPDYDPNVPASSKYFKSLENTLVGRATIGVTEKISEATKGAIEISPADLNYAFNQYIGGAGRSITKLTSTIAAITTGKELEKKEIPVLSRFLKGRDDEETLQSLYYTEKEKADKEAARQKVSDVRRITPIYEEAQMLLKEGKEDEAKAIVNNLSEEDYEIYKKMKASDKRRATSSAQVKICPTVKQVQDLLKQGNKAEAQRAVDVLTDEEYKAYQAVKKQLGL